MRTKACLLSYAGYVLLGLGSASKGQATDDVDALESLAKIAGQAMVHSRAYFYLEELNDSIGPRLTGSPEAARASDWALRKMEAIGLKNTHLEHWQLERGWRRGHAWAELVSPIHLHLNIASLGWVGSTQKGGVEADVVLVDSDSLAEEVRKNASRWAGEILLLVAKGSQHLGSGELFSKLGPFLEVAHQARAVAVIYDDQRPGTMLPHTGPASLSNALHKIPTVDMAKEHRKQITRLLEKGQSVRVKMDVQNQVSPGPIESSNVVGEIPGYEHPEQVVFLGAHLDTWDLGTGAADDGFGVASVLAAAEAISAAGVKPRRTIRFVLFTGEEQGRLGSRAYLRSHQSEISNYICSLVLDWGHGPITGMPVAGHDELIPPLQHFAEIVTGLGTLKVEGGYLNFTDAYSFTLAGVPGIAFLQNSPDYTLLGHSAADTLDKIDSGILVRDSALVAQAAFWIANHPTRLGTGWTPNKTAQVLTKDKQRPILEALGEWPFSP